MKRSGKKDLCQGPILWGMFMYALPLIATGVLQTLYNSADTAIVGRFAGDISLAAVSSTASVINLLVNLFMGLSTGILTVVARHIGAKHSEYTQKAVHTAIPLALICGAFLTVVGVFVAKPLLEAIGTGGDNPTVFRLAVQYTQIYFLGIPGLLLYNFGAAILRAAGDTKRPLAYLTVSGVLNVILNVLFVVGFHWNVAGVALATILSQYVSAVLVVIRLIHETGHIRLIPSQMRVDGQQLKEMLRIGVPSGFNSSMFGIANVIIRAYINEFPYLYVAGAGAGNQIENLLYTMITAFYTTTLAYTSQNFGAKNVRRIRRVFWHGHLLNFASCALVVPLILIFSGPLLSVFTSEQVAISAGQRMMYIMMSTVVLDGAMNIQVGHLRGMGFSFVPMINSLVGTCGLRIVWLIVIFPHLGGTWEALWWCYPVTWFITFAAHAVYTLYADRILKKFPADQTSAAAGH